LITRAEKIRLGLFLIISAFLIIGTISVLIGLTIWQRRDLYYISYTESVSGLEVGAGVKKSGVNVGRVESLTFDLGDPNAVIVEISLESGVPVQKDAKALIGSLGITGIKYIEIEHGSYAAELLKPGDFITAGESFTESITGKATDIAIKMDVLLNNLLKLTNQKNRQLVTEILESIRNTTVKINEIVDKTANAIVTITFNVEMVSYDLLVISNYLKNTMVHVNFIAEDSEPRVQNILMNFERISAKVMSIVEYIMDEKKVASILSHVDTLLVSAQRQLSKLDVSGAIEKAVSVLSSIDRITELIHNVIESNRPNIWAITENITDMTEKLKEFGLQISEDPSRLIFSRQPADREVP
jgi:phospholipid/cholesterol/gamma-HCH transport system substrate-binding protein